MGKKWGSNANIHIGDIFYYCGDYTWGYYQVVALKGKTQVVLHAIGMEWYINEGIGEDSPLFWRKKRRRPLPGWFLGRNDGFPVYSHRKKDKEFLEYVDELTAWVLPDVAGTGDNYLRIVGWLGRYGSIDFIQEFPKDWEPWTPEQIKLLEEYEQAKDERYKKLWEGDEDPPWPEYPL